MSAQPAAIVIGLDCITGLQTARILAGHGVPVVGIARDPRHFCCSTRACGEVVAADTKSEAFVGVLESIGPRWETRPVLVPCTDASVHQVSRHRDRLKPWYRFALPPADVVEQLIDKVAFYRYAASAGLPIPPTFFLASREDADRAAAALRYPCILKPPMKTARWERNTTRKVFKLESAADLLACYDRCATWADSLMVQEWIEGADDCLYSCNAYFDSQSRPLATFVARKLRQWPPETGTSCLGEECRDDEVLEASLRLFQGVGYHGLGYVEMKRDARTGGAYIIEPNIGRPTGRSAIAESGGVELLYTMYRDVTGQSLPERRVQRYGGAKWIYLRHDLQSAFHYWRRGELSAAQWLRSMKGVRRDAVLKLSDPGPGLADFRNSVRAAVFGRPHASASRRLPAGETRVPST